MTRLRVIVLSTVLAVLAALTLGVSTASAAACSTGWGSLPKSDPVLSAGTLTGVRVGIHPCFDRVVFDVRGPAAGYSVRYVRTVFSEGRGAPLYVPGGARLAVDIHNNAGRLPYLVNQKAANVTGFPVLRSVTYGGSFEGHTTYGVGVVGVRPFHVMVFPGLGGITYVVLDIARTT